MSGFAANQPPKLPENVPKKTKQDLPTCCFSVLASTLALMVPTSPLLAFNLLSVSSKCRAGHWFSGLENFEVGLLNIPFFITFTLIIFCNTGWVLALNIPKTIPKHILQSDSCEYWQNSPSVWEAFLPALRRWSSLIWFSKSKISSFRDSNSCGGWGCNKSSAKLQLEGTSNMKEIKQRFFPHKRIANRKTVMPQFIMKPISHKTNIVFLLLSRQISLRELQAKKKPLQAKNWLVVRGLLYQVVIGWSLLFCARLCQTQRN